MQALFAASLVLLAEKLLLQVRFFASCLRPAQSFGLPLLTSYVCVCVCVCFRQSASYLDDCYQFPQKIPLGPIGSQPICFESPWFVTSHHLVFAELSRMVH